MPAFLFLTCLLLLSLSVGCRHTAEGVKADSKNALEKTGAGIEKAGHKTGEGLEKAGRKTGEGLEKAGQKIENAGGK